jgi:potassium large conductance calcium-activated channel subfamily M alpha protein 1
LTPNASSKSDAANSNGDNQASNVNSEGEIGPEIESNEGTEGKKFGKNEDILLDAQTIFKYNIIKKKNPQVNVVTELISKKNIAFLLDDPLLYNIMKDYDYDQTPTFASGEVYLSSLMDSLICQAYYNPALITVLSKLLVGDMRHQKKSPSLSQGQQPLNSLLGDTNIRQDGDFSYFKTSNLYHYKVPKEYYGMKYKALFKQLVTKRFMIPLGIYRMEKVSFAGLDPSYG